jgi:predicted glycogen debranching enzyme
MKRPTITIPSEALAQFNEAVQKEWLITNGLGGYAASTILGLNTRKYHGLLVAVLHPLGDRTVCLAKMDEDLLVGEGIYRLGANEFQRTIFPQGYLFLKTFSISPFPTFTYHAENITVKKTIFMPYQKNATIAIYTILNKSNNDAKLRVFPIMTCRGFHTVVEASRNPLSLHQEHNNRKLKLTFTAPDATVLTYASAGEFVEKPNWINALHYREENIRGEIDTDNVYQPGYYELSVGSNQETRFAIVAAASENSQKAVEMLNSFGSSMPDFDHLLEAAIERRSRFLDTFYASHEAVVSNPWLNWILLATDSFVTHEQAYPRSIIAGYFWFGSWGRDTFISLPGLLLVTGRFDDAKDILQSFSRYCKNGLIPNLIPEESRQPVYNNVDGTFWYVNAVLQYLKYTNDFKFVKDQLWTILKSIIENHEHGTDFGIHLDSDGLISHGERLTWMDASIAGKAVTPRAGKAVEIQALWYNALRIMAFLANRFDETDRAEKYVTMAAKAKKSFNEKFWNLQKNRLFDVLEASGPDLTLRPNQIIATSLDFTMLDAEKNKYIVNVVEQEFLTPCGLRTLSRNDPRYKNIYSGNVDARDQAYHNGAVWPWLLGQFITGFLKTGRPNDQNLEFTMKNFVQMFFEKQIFEGGLGTVNELFDGDAPHKPRGCIAQAWSVAEPLRAYVEDVLQIRPKYEKEILKFSE